MKIKPIMHIRTAGAVLVGLSLMSLPAFTQDVENLDNGISTTPPQEVPVDQSGRLPISVSAGFAHQFKTDLSDVSGSFSITRFKASIGVPIRFNEQWTLRTTTRYQLDSFEWEDTSTPWHNINTLSIAPVLHYRWDDTWSFYGGGFFRMSAESRQEMDRGASGGGILGVNYKMSDTLTLGGGLAIVSQIKDDTIPLPLFTAKWQFAERWRLDVGLTDVANYGYGAEVKWLFSNALDFGFGAQYHRSRFRIAGTGAFPDSTDGVGQETAVNIYAETTWHACTYFDLSGFFGVAAGGKVRLESTRGDKLGEEDYKAAPIVGVRGTFRF